MKRFAVVVGVVALSLLPGRGGSHHLRYASCLNPTTPGSHPISHVLFEAQLKKYVNAQGMVNYAKWQTDSVTLNRYLLMVSNNQPNEAWTSAERLAYWLNAYNAFTIQRVLRGYPVRSIRDLGGNRNLVNTVWDQHFIRLGREKYCLNDLEQRIIRCQFDDYRVHFALVCAAVSCPKLRREAYVANRLPQQLQDQGSDFINDPTKNKLTATRAELSSIFSFYPDEFMKEGNTLQKMVNRYARHHIQPDAHLTYLAYNWALNDQKQPNQRAY